jgi:hypothetical protein
MYQVHGDWNSMSDRIRKTEAKIDLERLRIEAAKLLWDDKLQQSYTQVSIQTDGADDWTNSAGSRIGVKESVWDKIHPALAGSWWETDFFPSLPWKVYRTRIMVMEGRRCYSIHKDDNPRLHIAITTTNQSRFIFTTPPEITHIPADGHVWWVDTRNEHTAINASMEPRVHLLMSLVNTDTD